FAKGGEYAPFYAGVHLLIDWRDDGAAIEANLLRQYPYLGGRANWVLHRENNYFYPGLTWPIKNRFSFKPWPLPAGCIFAHVGAAAFVEDGTELATQGLMSSGLFTSLLRLMAGWNYEVGTIRQVPLAVPDDSRRDRLAQITEEAVAVKLGLDRTNEISHAYLLP